MTDVRKADPTAQRRLVVILIAGTCVGAMLIAGFERFRVPLSQWILADPGAAAQRARLVLLALTMVLLAPVFAFAAYLWALGERIVRAQEFPPPGLRVIRDTPVITAAKAVSRGRFLKVLALGCCVASAVLGFLLWRFVVLLST